MKTISQSVWDIISSDSIALDYLYRGLLNSSAYAQTIKDKIKKDLMIEVSSGSIVTALNRIKVSEQTKTKKVPKFIIEDLSFKLPITELVFKKNENYNLMLGQFYSEIQNFLNPHFNVVNVENELDIFLSNSLVETLFKYLPEKDLIYKEINLSALILKYDPQYRQYSGMASQILNALAINSIRMTECLTTYREFIIYIDQNEANKAMEVLNKHFMQ